MRVIVQWVKPREDISSRLYTKQPVRNTNALVPIDSKITPPNHADAGKTVRYRFIMIFSAFIIHHEYLWQRRLKSGIAAEWSLFMRKSGILMHISSLPSEYGIGKMGKAAYDFVDFLAESGVKCWQILQIGRASCRERV